MNDTAVDILYVEDDPLASRLLEEVCRSSRTPVRVRTARDRDAAVEALTSDDQPDLVLVSLEFGAVRGLEVLRALRRRVDLDSVPVVAFGNSDDPVDVADACESGADAYAQKPPNFSELLDLVEPLVAAPRRAALVGMSPQPVQQPHRERA